MHVTASARISAIIGPRSVGLGDTKRELQTREISSDMAIKLLSDFQTATYCNVSDGGQ